MIHKANMLQIYNKIIKTCIKSIIFQYYSIHIKGNKDNFYDKFFLKTDK